MDLLLKDRVYIVTGGSSGIGKNIVCTLLAEGARVATCARYNERLEELALQCNTQNLLVRPVDVLDESGTAEFVDHVAQHFGCLDGVVTNAGAGCIGRVFDATKDEWQSQFAMKVFSVMNAISPSIDYLRQSDAGRIVIMNGITSKRPEPTMAAVSAARAAVSNLAQSISIELAPDNICVNTINIGAVDTGRQLDRYHKAKAPASFEEWKAHEAERRGIALRRFGRVEEVSPFVALCLSPLSSYLTSAEIDLFGGGR